MLDRLIQGGRAVTLSGVDNRDAEVMGEHIVAVTLPGLLPAGMTQQALNARGRMVGPGGIETHVYAVANVQPGACNLVPGVPNAGAARTLAGSHLGRDDGG